MTAIEELERLIKEKREEIRSLELALQALQQRNHNSADLRYKGMQPIEAMKRVLSENGGEMDEERLIDELVGGGILIGKVRGISNVRVSLKANHRTGAIVVENGKVRLGAGASTEA